MGIAVRCDCKPPKTPKKRVQSCVAVARLSPSHGLSWKHTSNDVQFSTLVVLLHQARHKSSAFAVTIFYLAQVQLLGSRSRLSVDVQCPTDSVNASSLLSDIDHAVSQAMGWGGTGGGSIPGPVHLNFMFRENLAPVDGKIR